MKLYFIEKEIKFLLEKGIMYKGYESPEPGDISDKDKEILSHAYTSCRMDNPGESEEAKTKCSKIAWASVNKSKESYQGKIYKKMFEEENLDSLVTQMKSQFNTIEQVKACPRFQALSGVDKKYVLDKLGF